MITNEMRMQLRECIRNGDESKQRQFLLNLLIMLNKNIDFLALYQMFEKNSFEEAEDPGNYRMYGAPYISEAFRWGNLRDRNGVAEDRLYYALREICEQCPECQDILEPDKPWVQVSNRLREIAYDIFSKLQDDEEESSDLSQMYEYLMEFVSSSPTESGEYYSLREIGQLMVRLLDPDEGALYDPCCGSGSLLIQAAVYRKTMHENGNFTADDRLRLYGQEMSPNAWKMARMNFLMHDKTCAEAMRNCSFSSEALHRSILDPHMSSHSPILLSQTED